MNIFIERKEGVFLKNDISYKFFIIWSFFIPISSFVLFPEIKGSLISYMIAFVSPCIVMLYKKIRYYYFIDFIKCFFIWLVFVIISQILNIINTISLDNIILVNPSDQYTIIFRDSLFTQSIYCLPGILLCLYAKYFYSKKWDKWLKYSIILFVLYGFYRCIFFTITGIDGDFISNRFFGDNLDFRIEYQTVMLAGTLTERMQSLSGEPSMFSFTVLPYFIFLVYKKINIIYLVMLGLSLILSTSTTAYLGLLIFCIILFVYGKVNIKYLGYICFICIILVIGFFDELNEIIQTIFVEKLSNDSKSTIERSLNIYNHIFYWWNLDVLHMLFGIGFGYIRSTDMFTTFLVNIGVIGVTVFTYFYLKNLKLRVKNTEDITYNAILLVVFFTGMISVPEFSYLSFWLFLGIIRNKYNKYKYISINCHENETIR